MTNPTTTNSQFQNYKYGQFQREKSTQTKIKYVTLPALKNISIKLITSFNNELYAQEKASHYCRLNA